MPRAAFRLRIKAGKEAEYDHAHKHVWPALLAKLKEVGISYYSIFRRDQDLFLFMHVEDFEAAWSALDRDPVNLQWQQEMSRLFEPVPGLQPGERFAIMHEVFYLE
ncbi:MAG TPA: L-rhamnose mutarotase [Candidatus Acidoferrum sp.]|nr:L-rhamnose mutarotase [Candidatus Acidoferrum sp.]